MIIPKDVNVVIYDKTDIDSLVACYFAYIYDKSIEFINVSHDTILNTDSISNKNVIVCNITYENVLNVLIHTKHTMMIYNLFAYCENNTENNISVVHSMHSTAYAMLQFLKQDDDFDMFDDNKEIVLLAVAQLFMPKNTSKDDKYEILKIHYIKNTIKKFNTLEEIDIFYDDFYEIFYGDNTDENKKNKYNIYDIVQKKQIKQIEYILSKTENCYYIIGYARVDKIDINDILTYALPCVDMIAFYENNNNDKTKYALFSTDKLINVSTISKKYKKCGFINVSLFNKQNNGNNIYLESPILNGFDTARFLKSIDDMKINKYFIKNTELSYLNYDLLDSYEIVNINYDKMQYIVGSYLFQKIKTFKDVTHMWKIIDNLQYPIKNNDIDDDFIVSQDAFIIDIWSYNEKTNITQHMLFIKKENFSNTTYSNFMIKINKIVEKYKIKNNKTSVNNVEYNKMSILQLKLDGLVKYIA